MRKNSTLLCLFVLLASLARAADAKAPESPLAPLASLVGGTWVGEVPVPDGRAPIQIELQFAWAENKQAVRFDSSFIREGKRQPYTSGLYAWNAAKGRLVIFYTDSGGSLTEGTITREGGILVNDLAVTEKSGKTTQVQVRLTKLDNDTFSNEIFVAKDGAWSPFVNVRYVRQPAAK
jgi:hypothetical protein